MDGGFEALYARYGREVHAYAARLTGDPYVAEEICQEVFVRYLQHEQALAGRNGHVAPWLFRVATNLGVDRLRRLLRGPRGARSLAAPEALPDPAPGQPQDADLAERIRRAVGALNPDLRAAFLLRAHHALTFAQLAEVLDLSERGAKDRYRRAREALAAALAPHIPEDER